MNTADQQEFPNEALIILPGYQVNITCYSDRLLCILFLLTQINLILWKELMVTDSFPLPSYIKQHLTEWKIGFKDG